MKSLLHSIGQLSANLGKSRLMYSLYQIVGVRRYCTATVALEKASHMFSSDFIFLFPKVTLDYKALTMLMKYKRKGVCRKLCGQGLDVECCVFCQVIRVNLTITSLTFTFNYIIKRTYIISYYNFLYCFIILIIHA